MDSQRHEGPTARFAPRRLSRRQVVKASGTPFAPLPRLAASGLALRPLGGFAHSASSAAPPSRS